MRTKPIPDNTSEIMERHNVSNHLIRDQWLVEGDKAVEELNAYRDAVNMDVDRKIDAIRRDQESMREWSDSRIGLPKLHPAIGTDDVSPAKEAIVRLGKLSRGDREETEADSTGDKQEAA